MMKKTNKFLKRLFCLCFSVLIFLSSVVLPVSALKLDDIEVTYTATVNKVWYPKSNKGVGTFTSSYYTFTSIPGDSLLTFTPKNDNMYNTRLENSTIGHQWSVLNLDITPTLDTSDINLDDYNLYIHFSVDNDALDIFPDESIEYEYEFLTPTLGITDNNILSLYGGSVPSINGIHGYDLQPYCYYDDDFYDDYLQFNGELVYNSYLFTETEDIEDILDGSYMIQLPFFNTNSSIEIEYRMVLEYDDGSSSSGGVSGPATSPGFSFVDPVVYSYDSAFDICAPAGQALINYGVMDFYSNNSVFEFSSRVRDYTDAFTVKSLGLMSQQYSTVLGVAYAPNITYDEYFVDSVFDTVSVTAPLTKGYMEDFKDLSLYGFRFDIYIAVNDTFYYSNYLDLITSAANYYFGYEPFSLTIGGVVIPYEYFKFDYDASNSCVRARLEFDGQNSKHLSYMKLIYDDAIPTVSFTFTVPTPYNANSVMVGFPSGGFWQKYDEPPVIPPEIPDKPDNTVNGGFTQEDINNAYNQGLNAGLNHNSNTNHVYGLFNGLFSAVFTFYSVVANGILIGSVSQGTAISLGTIISSLLIIFVVWFVVKKVTPL